MVSQISSKIIEIFRNFHLSKFSSFTYVPYLATYGLSYCETLAPHTGKSDCFDMIGSLTLSTTFTIAFSGCVLVCVEVTGLFYNNFFVSILSIEHCRLQRLLAWENLVLEFWTSWGVPTPRQVAEVVCWCKFASCHHPCLSPIRLCTQKAILLKKKKKNRKKKVAVIFWSSDTF